MTRPLSSLDSSQNLPPYTQILSNLRAAGPIVLPSMLLCDFGNLEREIELLEEAGVEALHMDVMDGQFVPNITYGMPVIEAIRKRTQMPIDVHLMIQDAKPYAKAFVDAGADLITFHVETIRGDSDIDLLDKIRGWGVAAGLAINPNTAMSILEPHLPKCDLVLIMSVAAGFGGQAFNPVALDRLRHLRKSLPSQILLEVDGGVNLATAASCVEAGADLLVAGSAIFKQPDYCQAMTHLYQAIPSKK